MKLAVYGATGMVGSQIAAEAVRRGHDVTALSRSGTTVDGATALAADFADLDMLQKIAGSHDVVVFSIAPDRSGGSHERYLATHHAIASRVMPARILLIGGAGSLEIDGVRLLDLPGFPDEYRPEAITMSQVLETYRASTTLDWTILAPAPQIAPGERTGQYRLGLDSPVGDGISTQDFAVAALDEIEDPKHRGQRFTVAN